jgi:hypothetical protein
MRKLRDLMPEELAALLRVTPMEAQQYIESADSIPFMQAPVEKVKEDLRGLKERGKLEKPLPDVAKRWRQVRELLFREPEFEARYPAAYAILLESYYPEIMGELIGLRLPSFGIRISRNEPKDHIGRKSVEDSYSDAYSVRASDMEGKTLLADQSYIGLDPGHLRAILLEIVSRDEYWERIHARYRDPELIDNYQVPTKSLVRITDLRLAVNLEAKVIKDNLVAVLDLLERPVTAHSVFEWKQKVLALDAAFLEQMPGDRESSVATISFAAAALLLFIDLDMPGVENGSSYRLAEQIRSLATVIRDLTRSLDKSAEELESLLANRRAGHPARLEKQYYRALELYRLGLPPEAVLGVLDIKPYNPETGKGTRAWKKRLKEKLLLAEQIERRTFPRAAKIFANRDNEYIRLKARQAYYLFTQEFGLDQESVFIPPTARVRWDWWGIKLGRTLCINTRTKRGREITKAYLELGFSQARGVPPLS